MIEGKVDPPIGDGEQLTEEEAARRRDEVIKRMLDTPPQPRTAKPQKASRRTDVKDSHDRYSMKPKP